MGSRGMRGIWRGGSLLAFLLVMLGSVATAAAQSTSSGSSSAKALRSLQRTLRGDLKRAGGRDGVLVVDQTTGQTLFSYRANTGRMPASVQKLYTTTAALLTYGQNARLRTSVYGSGSLNATGTWRGTLYLRGGGDPSFGSVSFNRLAYDGAGSTVQALVRALAAAGIKSVAGRVEGDESWFDSRRGTPATGYKPSLWVEGELSGLSFDAGFTNAYEDQLQPHPARFAAEQFAGALHGGGIRTVGKLKIGAAFTPRSAKLLTSVPSPTISRLIRLTNAPSDNFFAETLLKDLGASFGGGGTTPRGAAIVRSVIASKLGLRPVFDDGSGLSRSDRTSPDQVVALLEHMEHDAAFWNSLAVAGKSGTMKYEMTHTRASGNCRGKTGTLHDVANLVGYCTARSGDRLVFAFLLNGQQNPDNGHAIEDQMGEALANYDP